MRNLPRRWEGPIVFMAVRDPSSSAGGRVVQMHSTFHFEILENWCLFLDFEKCSSPSSRVPLLLVMKVTKVRQERHMQIVAITASQLLLSKGPRSDTVMRDVVYQQLGNSSLTQQVTRTSKNTKIPMRNLHIPRSRFLPTQLSNAPRRGMGKTPSREAIICLHRLSHHLSSSRCILRDARATLLTFHLSALRLHKRTPEGWLHSKNSVQHPRLTFRWRSQLTDSGADAFRVRLSILQKEVGKPWVYFRVLFNGKAS